MKAIEVLLATKELSLLGGAAIGLYVMQRVLPIFLKRKSREVFKKNTTVSDTSSDLIRELIEGKESPKLQISQEQIQQLFDQTKENGERIKDQEKFYEEQKARFEPVFTQIYENSVRIDDLVEENRALMGQVREVIASNKLELQQDRTIELCKKYISKQDEHSNLLGETIFLLEKSSRSNDQILALKQEVIWLRKEQISDHKRCAKIIKESMIKNKIFTLGLSIIWSQRRAIFENLPFYQGKPSAG
jgi:predicted  nucleic acid-binding Zn-ribbon protein